MQSKNTDPHWTAQGQGARLAAALTDAFADSGATVSARDGSVTVTLAANGALQNLQLGPRACELGPARLTATIMETVRLAQSQTARSVASSLEAITGDGEATEMVKSFLPPDPEADDELDQTKFVEDPEPDPAPPPTPPGPPPNPAPRRRPDPYGDYESGDVGVHNPKDVITDPEHTAAGAGIFDAGVGLAQAIEENNEVGIGIGSAGMALETLGLALDPIGSILAAGIGWIIEHITIKKFDKMSNWSVGQLSKVLGPAGAHRFEAVVKTLTDPMYGGRGLAGKTLVDIIKGVPASANPAGGDEEE